MARFSLVIMAILLSCLGLTIVHACENGCRDDPVTFLTKKYQAILDLQSKTLLNAQDAAQSSKLSIKVISKISGRNKVLDRTIFNMFRGHCVEPGKRGPEEFCGSAKSIACFAPWGHQQSLFDTVHAQVVKVVKDVYAKSSPEVQAAMVEGVANFCPQNCDDWIKPFQDIMLVWEQREHPHAYKATPNCLELGKGGI